MNLEHGQVQFSRSTQTIVVISGGELTLATGWVGELWTWISSI